MDEEDVVALVGGLETERLRVWVARGWVRPRRVEGRLRFTEIDIARVELVCRLTEELELAEDQVPPVLSLIDQVHGLRARMRALIRAIEAEPEEVRTRLGAAVAGPRRPEADEA